MFASAYIGGIIYGLVSGESAITDVVGDRIERQLLPQIQREPDGAFLIYAMPAPSLDDGWLGGKVASQECRFEIAIYLKGRDPSPIVAAADAMNALFEDMDENAIEIEGDTQKHQLTCRRENELGDLPWEFGAAYVRVGGTYVFTFV